MIFCFISENQSIYLKPRIMKLMSRRRIIIGLYKDRGAKRALDLKKQLLLIDFRLRAAVHFSDSDWLLQSHVMENVFVLVFR